MRLHIEEVILNIFNRLSVKDNKKIYMYNVANIYIR